MKRLLKQHFFLILILVVYFVLMLTILSWGLPGNERVFNYHMDEWHSFMAIKSIWQQGTNNVSGSANGSMGHFIISGISLIPLILNKFINIGNLTSTITGLETQRRIFQVLRINTLAFGIMALITVYLILKNHFKVKSSWIIAVMAMTPVWLNFSNFYRYDIALVSWISLALLMMLRYSNDLKPISYILTGVVVGIAISVKLTAIPLLGLYFLSFFYFQNEKKNYKVLLRGLSVSLLVFLLIGIPDILLGKGDYRQLIDLVLNNRQSMSDVIPQLNPWIYLILVRLPQAFGYSLITAFTIGLLIWLKELKAKKSDKKLKFILIGLVLFGITIGYLGLSATWVRLLVLLPFIIIFTGAAWERMRQRFKKRKWLIKLIIIFIVIMQLWQSLKEMSYKWKLDPRQEASIWLKENLSEGAHIGLEPMPIYGMVPDLILKDYFFQENTLSDESLFNYEIINQESPIFPGIVIISNYDQRQHKLFENKQKLVKKIRQLGYQQKASFYGKSSEARTVPSIISIFIDPIKFK